MIDLMHAFTHEPPQLDFVWGGFLLGTVGTLIAPGATGKSFWALEAAMSLASSVAGADLIEIKPEKTGRVIYYAGEDPEPALINRVHAIGKHLGHEARQQIANNLRIEPIIGKKMNIMDIKQMSTIIKYCQGSRLIIFDTLSRIHLLDENSNGEMAQLIATLEYLAVETGASVLYLHHVNKSSARDGQTDQQQAARGASSLIDNARWCGYVAKMSEEEATTRGIKLEDRRFYVKFGVSKQNYDMTPVEQWYERKAGGVLMPAFFNPLLIEPRNNQKKRERI